MFKPASVIPITRNREVAVFRNHYGSLYNDEITGPTGQEGRYLRWVWSHCSVAVVPYCDDAVALWWMYRYPTGTTLLEFPRGGVDRNETAANAALRELREEAGLIGSGSHHIGRLNPESGLIGSHLEVFAVAVDREAVAEPSTEPMESIVEAAQWLRPEAMSRAITDGDITCSITIAAWTMFRANAAR